MAAAAWGRNGASGEKARDREKAWTDEDEELSKRGEGETKKVAAWFGGGTE